MSNTTLPTMETTPPPPPSTSTLSSVPISATPIDPPTFPTLPPSNPPPTSPPPPSSPSPSSPPPPSSHPLSEPPTPSLSSIGPTDTQGQSSTPAMPPPSTPSGPLTTLTAPSTAIMQLTSVGTIDGRVFTTTFQITTVHGPGSVISSPPRLGGNGVKAGAIAGSVVGGIAFILLLLLAFLLLRRHHRRQHAMAEFDGNFDPARFSSSSRTTTDDDHDDNDGVGGRLGGGAGRDPAGSGSGSGAVALSEVDAEMSERVRAGAVVAAGVVGAHHTEQRSGNPQHDDGHHTSTYGNADMLRGKYRSGSGSIPRSLPPSPVAVGSSPDFDTSTGGAGTPSSADHGMAPLDPQYVQPISVSELLGLGLRGRNAGSADG